jgi:hypothetical protein
MIPHIVIALLLRDVILGVQRRNLSPQKFESQGFSRWYDCTLAIFLVRNLKKTNIGGCTVGDEGLETRWLLAILRL